MVELKYPHVLAEVRKHERSQWAIADALMQDCPKGDLSRVEEELKASGFEYSTAYLRDLRTTARMFPEGTRTKFAFTLHNEAGSPKILQAAIAAAEAKGVDVSKRFIRAYVTSLESEEHRVQRRKHETAKSEHDEAKAEREAAARAKHKARNAAERARAEREERAAEERAAKAREKVQDTKPAPQKKAERKPDVTPDAIVKAQFNERLSTIIGLTRAMKKDIAPIVDSLSKSWIDGTEEELRQAAANLIKLAELITKTQARGSHLSVVAS